MILDFITKHRQLSLILFFLIVVAPIAYFMYISLDRAGKTLVAVAAAPGDATITVDGTRVPTGDIYLKPGTYAIKATRQGFADYSTTVTVGQDKKTVIVLLNPNANEGYTWMEKNADQVSKVEGIAGDAARKEGETFQDKNPIVSLLPYSNLLYTIGYRADPDDPNSIIIEIDAPEAYRSNAIYQIYQWGYDPTNYKINFKNFKNQFEL